MKHTKYHVGDRVRIKSLDWYNANKDTRDQVMCHPSYFVPDMARFCGQVMTIRAVECGTWYRMKEDTTNYNWTDGMIEGLADVPAISPDAEGWVNEFACPDGYEFRDENGNVINGQKIFLEKKKPKYPHSVEDCCEILDYPIWGGDIGYKSNLLMKFQMLLICRDAYWKIAGEQMGLGKPWDMKYGSGEWGYWIASDVNANKIYCQDSRILVNHLLVFPTTEMRDAFYENFKELIEQCKELL